MIASAKKSTNVIIVIILAVLAVLFMIPMVLVLINSLKSKLFISSEPFALPTSQTFVGLENYINGLSSSGFFAAFGRSLFITVASVVLIVLCTAMTSWFITRIKNKITQVIYYAFVFSMIVPFQMVMFTMT